MNGENNPRISPQIAPGLNDSTPGRPLPPLEDFIAYCKANPKERFWEALRNWSGQDFILFGNMSNRLGGKEFATIDDVKVYVRDTFNLSKRNE